MRYLAVFSLLLILAGCAGTGDRSPAREASSFYLTNIEGEIIATGKISLPSDFQKKESSASYSLSLINKGGKLGKSEDALASALGDNSDGTVLLECKDDGVYSLTLKNSSSSDNLIVSATLEGRKLSGDWSVAGPDSNPFGKFEAFVPED